MIKKIETKLGYSQEDTDNLSQLNPPLNSNWDKPPNDKIKELKRRIRNDLLNNQKNTCAYCGLDLGGTSEGQIEHIAPKAKYPEFTFEKENLAMACHYCNGFSKKGNYDTIEHKNYIYQNCSFKLVHPYFDDPIEHYGWVANDKKVIIKALSDKGKYSIEMLKLDAPLMTILRGKKIIADIVISTTDTPQIDDNLINSVLNYKS
ncbi:MAG: TIGR02646 family protein [Bacteroidales bacterium]|nr:TIGR02646 family protein [Bacteroidales bacterium]